MDDGPPKFDVMGKKVRQGGGVAAQDRNGDLEVERWTGRLVAAGQHLKLCTEAIHTIMMRLTGVAARLQPFVTSNVARLGGPRPVAASTGVRTLAVAVEEAARAIAQHLATQINLSPVPTTAPMLRISPASAPVRPSSAPGTIGALLDAQVSKNHYKRALRVTGQDYSRWSYGELKRQVEALAIGLGNVGVGRGDKAAVALGNSIEAVTILLACAKAGVAVVPVDVDANDAPEAAAAKYTAALKDGARVLFFHDTLGPNNHVKVLNEVVPELVSTNLTAGDVLVSDTFPELSAVVNMGRTRQSGMMRFEWLFSYSFVGNTGEHTAGVGADTPFLSDGKKTLSQKDVVALATDKASGVSKAITGDSLIAVATHILSPSGFAYGLLAPIAKGASSVLVASADAINSTVQVDKPAVLVVGAEEAGHVDKSTSDATTMVKV